MKNQFTVPEVFASAFNGNEFSVDFQTGLAVAVPLLILVVIACAMYRFNKVNKRVKDMNREV